MGILQELVKEIKDNDITQQVREICDKIYEQEHPNFDFPEFEPKGPNVFLCLEVPGRYTKEIGFLTLERVSAEHYVAVFHTIEKSRLDFDNPEDSPMPRRQKTWDIDENKATKIVAEFAKLYKMLRGE